MVTPDPKDERLEDRSATETYPEPERAGGLGGAAIRLLALGINAWIVGILLPASGAPSLALADQVLIALPPIALVLGLRALLRRDPSALGLLGVAVPVLSVAAMAGRSDPALASRYGTATTLFAVASSIAYVVGVAHVLGRPAALRATRETKLAASTRLRPPARALRIAVLATTAVLAFAIAVVAPALGTQEAMIEQWGEAASEGRVVTAIVGGAIACIATAIVVGPSLRAERGRPARPGEGTLTVTLSLVVAATGAIAWAILRTVAP